MKKKVKKAKPSKVKAKVKKKSPPKATPQPEKPPKKATPKAEPTPVVPLPAAEVRNMDRKSLKAMAYQLTEMGVEVKVLKSDDDAALQAKVSAALNSLPSPEVLQKLETIDPEKLAPVLKKDCLGLYIDLRAAACISCPDNVTCVKEFMKNLKGNFEVFKPAMKEIEVEEQAAKITPEVAAASAKASKKTEDKTTAKAAPKIVWNPKRKLVVANIDNPLKKKHDAHATFQAILDELSVSTMKELRDIIERDWEVDDEAFVEEWLHSLRENGVVKLDVDLTDTDKAELAEAGITL